MMRTRFSGLAAFADVRVALMLALGFSAGLPYLLVFGTLSAWLAELKVPLPEIGLLSYVALAYTLKFLWAPIVDAVDVPVLARLLGRRRAWMVVSQLGIALGLVGMAFTDPARGLLPTIACAFAVAFASATQDVVIDAWRIEAAESSRQGAMAASYQLGYRIGLLSAGAGALYIADFTAWPVAYLTMAALMAVGLAASLIAPAVEHGAPAGRHLTPAAVAAPFRDLARRYGPRLLPILALVTLYRLPDFVAGVMANPLYITLGFTKSEIASISKLYGVVVGLVGAFAGGAVVARFGLRTALVAGAAAATASHLLFALLALKGARIEYLTLCISVDSFAGGLSGTALVAFMSAIAGRGYAATQYAVLSSLYALPGKLVAGSSGFMAQSFGFPAFFAFTAAIGLPCLVLALIVAGMAPDESREAEEAVAEPARPLAQGAR
jgi:PAT family beta-lactamase induction signal transducer AmpG